jgi:two-component system cell cycle response regulator
MGVRVNSKAGGREDDALSIIQSSVEADISDKRVLIVDDEQAFRGILRSFVESLGYTCTDAESGQAALNLLKRMHFPIVISDIVMPEMDGVELLRAIKKRYSDVDVLIITGYRGDYSAMKIVQAGASDFLAKPFSLEQLGARLYKIEMEKKLRSKLYLKSITDELTGLYNRGYFYQKLKREAQRARRQGYSLSIIMLDVDGFKQFNDRYGHIQGDALLKTVGRVIQFSVREHVDSVFRYGGDEFAAVLPEADETTALLIGGRIKGNLCDAAPSGITLSLGAAELRGDVDVEAFVNVADKRMYEEKSKSKGLEYPLLKVARRDDHHYIRCLNCGHRVHWTSSVCQNCLADPLRKTDSQRSQEIARTLFREVHPSLEDRRRSPRIRIRKTIMDERLQATIHNISLGGAQIETERLLTVGKVLHMALPLEGEDVRLSGVVVYVQSPASGGSLAGIQFSEVSDKDSELLKRFLDVHSLNIR